MAVPSMTVEEAEEPEEPPPTSTAFNSHSKGPEPQT